MNQQLQERPTASLWILLILGTITSLCLWFWPLTIVLIVVLCKRMDFNRQLADKTNNKIVTNLKENSTTQKNNIRINDDSELLTEWEEKIRYSAYNFTNTFLPKWNKIWSDIFNNIDEFDQYLIIQKSDDKGQIVIKKNLTIWKYLELIVKLEKKPLYFFTYTDLHGFKYFNYEKGQKVKYLDDYKKANHDKKNIVVLNYEALEKM